ncbi:dienelactone hydrolase family protein [Zalerion maritima]|uniref:Dienelactone hydrolase family protein n=1 Tax=Zalerion maritima TaxID=339359 RepID=A0AAD5RRT3_9PEZI|nr:dienelactone hydrolase family protein [Zalerion maritima]
MLIEESFTDLPTSTDGKESSMRIFLFHPKIPGYPKAKFPGVCVFSEIYQGSFASGGVVPTSPVAPPNTIASPNGPVHTEGPTIPDHLVVTGPVARFARQIAGHGYICAAPSSYHDFTGPEPLAYDGPGTDDGNKWKVEKTLASYDEDSRRTVDCLLSLPTCTGLIGSTGMCLGGHLAVRASLDPRITACVAYFATDIHKRSLGPHSIENTSASAPSPDSPHTMDNFKKLKAETAMIFGLKDTHVSDDGRDLIRTKMRDAGCCFSWHEFAWAQHAFIRDELSKGRYDPAVTKVCWEVMMELFGRRLKIDLGEVGEVGKVEDVC